MECLSCQQISFFNCGHCLKGSYCSKRCQLEDWDIHKVFCINAPIDDKKTRILEAIRLLKREDHRSHANALKMLIREDFFGENYRAINGRLMWKLINEWNRLPPIQSDSYIIRKITKGMIKFVKSEDYEGKEENLQYIDQLIEEGHFGDLSRVPKNDDFSLYMEQQGLGPQYEDWRNKLYY